MSEPDKTQPSIEDSNDSIIDWIMGSDTDISVAPSSSSTVPRIPKVPASVKEKHNYDIYYVPKFVSIGPYHFGDPKLLLVEKRKRVIAKKLFSNNKEALTSLYEKLGEHEMLKGLRSFYEANSTTKYCDKVFTKMMLLDGCFIVYFILFLYHGSPEDYPELKSNEIFFVHRDLYLLENQILLIVLKEVVTILIRFKNPIDWLGYFKRFISLSSFVMRTRPKRKWLHSLNIIRLRKKSDEEDAEPNHLLGAVHGKHIKVTKAPTGRIDPRKFHGYNFRNVSELVDLGIHFKPINNTLSMTHIEFVKGQWGFSANVKLPPVAVTDYTKPMLLNLMAYETCLGSLNNSRVTSYINLLNYLIDNAEDVKVLRKSLVLRNYLASDQEVVKLFDEIGTDLTENSSAYLLAKYKIQEHYESGSNTLLSQLKKEYFKSPRAIFALLGALIALFLSAVQTFYTVWSPEGRCDDLCMFLKKNHHL